MVLPHFTCIDFIATSHFRNDLPFNEKQLAPILDDLEEHWLNVRNGTGEYSFWEHEWLKHGTCAVQIPELNTEFKYFSKGIDKLIQSQLKMLKMPPPMIYHFTTV